ncbi:protein MTO1 mitochondrial [Biomphalaria glabrata]
MHPPMIKAHFLQFVTDFLYLFRYCPSIESKILKFNRKSHQIWLEPEGLDSDVIYPQGMSCTMPEEFQVALMRSIPGLENCKLVRAGLC